MKKRISFLLCILTLSAFGCSANTNKEVDSDKQKETQTIDNQQKHNMDNLTKVLISTSMGDITIALYEETPLHKANFIKLVKEGFYENVLFHRIIKEFMIQTGDPDSKSAAPGQPLGSGGPGYTIPAEFVPTLYHKRGAVAAARLGDQMNPKKESSGSQFYIVDGKKCTMQEMQMISMRLGKKFSDEQIKTYTTLGGDPFLDGDYTVFGEVVEGMDVVDKIASQAKDRRDRPTEDIIIISTTILE